MVGHRFEIELTTCGGMEMNAGFVNLALLGGFILLVYFMMIRPQRKMDKQNKQMRESLKSGDEIITIGGIVAKVSKIKDKTVVVTIGEGKTKMEILKTAVASVKTTHDNEPKEKKAVETEAPAPSREKKVVAKKLTESSHNKDNSETSDDKEA